MNDKQMPYAVIHPDSAGLEDAFESVPPGGVIYLLPETYSFKRTVRIAEGVRFAIGRRTKKGVVKWRPEV